MNKENILNEEMQLKDKIKTMNCHLSTLKSQDKNVFEKIDAEIRWKLEVQDMLNEVNEYKNLNESILYSLDEIREVIQTKQNSPEDTILDNNALKELLGISNRTLQTWRDSGIISFSRVGSKLYYRLSDVLSMLNKNYYQSQNNSN